MWQAGAVRARRPPARGPALADAPAGRTRRWLGCAFVPRRCQRARWLRPHLSAITSSHPRRTPLPATPPWALRSSAGPSDKRSAHCPFNRPAAAPAAGRPGAAGAASAGSRPRRQAQCTLHFNMTAYIRSSGPRQQEAGQVQEARRQLEAGRCQLQRAQRRRLEQRQQRALSVLRPRGRVADRVQPLAARAWHFVSFSSFLPALCLMLVLRRAWQLGGRERVRKEPGSSNAQARRAFYTLTRGSAPSRA